MTLHNLVWWYFVYTSFHLCVFRLLTSGAICYSISTRCATLTPSHASLMLHYSAMKQLRSTPAAIEKDGKNSELKMKFVNEIIWMISYKIYRTASLLRPARCYTPPPPTFGRNYCIGLFYLHYTPPPLWAARAGLPYCSSARVRVLQV